MLCRTEHLIENICLAASGLKAPNVIAWGEAQRAEPQVTAPKKSVRAESAGHGSSTLWPIISALQASGGLRNRLPGPPLALLAPAQAISWRAFSPEECSSVL